MYLFFGFQTNFGSLRFSVNNFNLLSNCTQNGFQNCIICVKKCS